MLWKKHVPALTRMALDPGLLNGWPAEKASWAQRNFLEPFYGKTVLVVELKGFPLSPGLLKLFLPDSMFARTTTGLVLMVPDWMQLSTDIDTFRGTWLQKESVARLERRL